MLVEETASAGTAAGNGNNSISPVSLAENQTQDLHNLHQSNNGNENDALSRSVIASIPNAKKTKVNGTMDRFPLRPLDTNSSSTPGGATPLSCRSKGSSSRAMDADYDYTNRYIVSLNYDEDDHELEHELEQEVEHEHEHEHELQGNNKNSDNLIREEENVYSYINDCSTIGQSTVTSANRKLDYDSVVYSGYAGSISAAPSDLSGEGFSIDNEGIQMNIAPSRHTRGAGNRNRIRLAASSRRGAQGDEDCNTNCTQTDCSASMSFSGQMKKFRERRRRIRADSQKAHKESILVEFRSFLFKNRQRPQDQDDNAEMQENLDVDIDVDVDAVGDGLEDEAPEGNIELRTPTFMRVRNISMSQDFTPTKLHGDVPWIVFHNDRDEDLSTINGGSRCGGFIETKDVESAWDHLHDEVNENENEDRFRKNGNARDRMEIVYYLLIAASVTTLTAVVAIIVVYT